MNCEIAGWENINTSSSITDWAPYDFTFYNYLYLREGYIFDGNGFEIKMDHSCLYDSVNNRFQSSIEKWGQEYPRAMLWGQTGPIRVEKYTTAPNYAQNKPITVKNLKITGTAPIGYHKNSVFGIKILLLHLDI